MNKIIDLLKDPYRICYGLWRRVAPLIKDDELYLKWFFYFKMHKFPDLEHPKSFNEKLTWLKLHSNNEELSKLVDKYTVKEYVAKKIGVEHIIPTLGVWDDANDIDFEKIGADQFVLKCTHDSGGMVFCKDKAKLNIGRARKELNKYLKKNFVAQSREYPYKLVKPRIIAEPFMVDESGTELKDYKFFCFDGEPKLLFVATDRPKDTRFDFFDMEWNHLPFKQGHPLAKKEIKRPKGFEQMKEIARRLSAGMRHVRVDLYDVNGHVYFGELTFFHFSGNVPFEPEEWDYKIGEWLKLPYEE